MVNSIFHEHTKLESQTEGEKIPTAIKLPPVGFDPGISMHTLPSHAAVGAFGVFTNVQK